jgi:putative (di)nucleoside polyphosphate hydrolase
VAKPAQYFRAGAGALIVNAEGHVLAIERADTAGAWQLPQGGLDASEEPLRAAYREIAEETGIEEADLEFVKACSELLAYELPPDARREKTGRGQVLYWFLFSYQGTHTGGKSTRNHESRGWRWMPLPRIIKGAVTFRRPMYMRLEQEFKDYLAPFPP